MRNFFYHLLATFQKSFLRKTENRLRVLAYHSVDEPELFEQQMIYLKENFNLIDIDLLQKILSENLALPKKALLVTFDDGEPSVLENGLPILVRNRIPAVVFIISELIGTDRAFWWKEIEYYLGEEEGTKKVWEVKKWNNQKRLNYQKELIENSTKPPILDKQLSLLQLKKLNEAGVVIANHSHTHPMFDQCNPQELEKEMELSFKYLETFHFRPDLFAYPNGNHSPLAEDILKKYNVNLAFLFDHKLNKDKIDPLRISRIRVDSPTEMGEFKVKVSGLHSKVYHSINKIKK